MHRQCLRQKLPLVDFLLEKAEGVSLILSVGSSLF